MNAEAKKPILVVGGGIAGMTAAVEAAEVGHRVVLVEKEAYLGGRTMRTARYFPKMCPPTCGFEINSRRIRQNPRITVHTLADVTSITGSAGDFKVKVALRPRYVTGNIALDESMTEGLEGTRPDEFNLGMGTTKALYLPHPMAWPSEYVLDKDALAASDVAVLQESVPEGGIDLGMEAKEIEIEAGAIVVATGWRPYDATKLDHLGFGAIENVVTNVMVERMAAKGGPTNGELLRPSDGAKPKNVAFVQCAGSRDENHLPYCSAVCCMASLKQARYLRLQDEEAKATIFYIDIRAVGRLEKFYYDLLEDENVSFVKGKVAGVREAGDGLLALDVEDTIATERVGGAFDLVVLATGIVPNAADVPMPVELGSDKYGFLDGTTSVEGIFAAGCARRPCDVSRTTKDATAAALRAIQCLNGGE